MREIETLKLGDLLSKYPFIDQYLENSGLNISGWEDKFFDELLVEKKEILSKNLEEIKGELEEYIKNMKIFLGIEEDTNIESLTIIAGQNKSKEAEGFDEISIKKSEVVAIVGPTGSGKSRLLGDIEWVAQGDTPTKRKILIDGEVPDTKWRFSSQHKLVAQLSQNMNFIMDLSVREFLELHAKSRMVFDSERVIEEIIKEANNLAGENFDLETQITALSGGQSRALMIADTAILSRSPIVLIDEIENAGIDRRKALKLLLSSNKIVLMATHDPYLTLLADRRIVIKNGGIDKIIETSNEEKSKLKELEVLDNRIQKLRSMIRYGEQIK